MTSRSEYAAARRQIKNLTRDHQTLQHQYALTKAQLDTYQQTIPNDTIRNLVTEYHALQISADPLPTPNDGPKSAETPQPGQSTKWARAKLNYIDRRIQAVTREIQSALKTPPEERTPIDNTGRCVGCGRKGKQR